MGFVYHFDVYKVQGLYLFFPQAEKTLAKD